MAAFEQHLSHCDQHEDCDLIVGYQDGTEVWRSHHPPMAHPEHRLNIDYPVVTDHRDGAAREVRWTLACDDCLDVLGWDEETLRRVAHAAHLRGLAPIEQLAAAVKTTHPELLDEAAVKGWETAEEYQALRSQLHEHPR